MGSEKKILIYLSHCLHKLLQFQTSAAVRPVPVNPPPSAGGPSESAHKQRGSCGAGAGMEFPRIHLSPPPQPRASQSPAGTKELGPVLTGPQASWQDCGGPGQLAQQGMAVSSGRRTQVWARALGWRAPNSPTLPVTLRVG